MRGDRAEEPKDQVGFGTRVLGAEKGHSARGSQNGEMGRSLSHHLCAPRPGADRRRPGPEVRHPCSSPARAHGHIWPTSLVWEAEVP